MKALKLVLLFFALVTLSFGNVIARVNYSVATVFYHAADAVDVFDLSASPDYNLGVAYYRQGDYTKSIKHFEEALGIAASDEQKFKIHYNLGITYFRHAESKFDVFTSDELTLWVCVKSLGSIVDAKEIKPEDADNNYNFGLIYTICSESGEETSDEGESDVSEDDIEKIEQKEKKNKDKVNKSDFNKYEVGDTDRSKPYW